MSATMAAFSITAVLLVLIAIPMMLLGWALIKCIRADRSSR